MRKITKRSAAIVTAAVVAVGGAGAAWAYWSSGGTGTVSGTAGSAQAVTVSALSVGTVTPGHPANVQFTVNNPNDYPVTLSTATLSNFTSTFLGCDAAATFVQNSAATLPVIAPIAAGGSSSVTWNNAVKLTADPDDDCQGKSFSFDLAVSANSAAS